MILNIIAIIVLIIVIPLVASAPSFNKFPIRYEPPQSLFKDWLDGVGIILGFFLLLSIIAGFIWCIVRVGSMLQ